MSPPLEPWPRFRSVHVDITPARPLPLAGYARPRLARGDALGALEANALLCAVDGAPLLLLALDALFGGDALRERLARRLRDALPGLHPGRVQLIASHTHCAPALDPTKPLLGVMDERHLDDCVERIATAVEGARAAPAHTAASCPRAREACHGNVYRRVETWVRQRGSARYRRQIAAAPDASVPIDRQLRLARLDDADGRPRCVLWSWPCHPVSLGQSTSLSPDFPGAVREALRARHGAGLTVLFLPGICGDVRPANPARTRRRPLRERLSMPFVGGFEPPDRESHARLCARVTAAALAADTAARTGDAAPGAARAEARDDGAGGASLGTATLPLTRLLEGLGEDERRRLELCAVTLPPLRLALLNAELCSGYADALTAYDFASGCANDVFGYLPTDRQIAEGGYEVDGFAPLFSLAGRYRTGIEAPVRALLGGEAGGD